MTEREQKLLTRRLERLERAEQKREDAYHSGQFWLAAALALMSLGMALFVAIGVGAI